MKLVTLLCIAVSAPITLAVIVSGLSSIKDVAGLSAFFLSCAAISISALSLAALIDLNRQERRPR